MAISTSPDRKFYSTKRTGLLDEVGRTGLITAGGYVLEEFLSEVSGLRWRRIVKEMLTNDPVTHSMFFLIELMTRGVEWKVEAAGEDNESQKQAEFLEQCMDDMSQSWSDTIAEIMSFLGWGWSWHEVVYKVRNGDKPLNLDEDGKPTQGAEDVPGSKYDDGRIGWRKIPIRSQDSLESWVFDANGGIQAMVQNTIFSRATIPIDKSLLFRTSTHKNNPEGMSLCRRIYRPWYFKQRIENTEGIGIERDLAGFPLGRMPAEYLNAESGIKKTIADEFKKIIVGIHRDEQEGAVVASDCFPGTDNPLFDIKLLNSGGTRQFDTSKIIQRYDQRILMTLMADFLLLGHDKVGSFALASAKTELFSFALGAWLDIVKDIFNRHAIPKLLRLNGMNAEKFPKLDHGDVESVDLDEIANFVSKTSGTIPLNDDQKRWVLRQLGVPVDEDAPLPEMPVPTQPPPGGGVLPAGKSKDSQAQPGETAPAPTAEAGASSGNGNQA